MPNSPLPKTGKALCLRGLGCLLLHELALELVLEFQEGLQVSELGVHDRVEASPQVGSRAVASPRTSYGVEFP